MKWLQRLVQRRVLTPLEQRLLSELEQRLDPSSARLLTAQVKQFNLAQRHANGRETCLYAMSGGRPHRDPSISFPATEREHSLATVQFEIPGEGSFRAEFYLVDGFLFSIEFTPGATRISEREDIAVKHVQLEIPPRRREAPIEREQQRATAAAAWLDEAPWSSKVTSRRPPLAPSGNERVAEIKARLPEDYLAAVHVSNGFGVGNVTVLPLEDVYDIVLEDASYYVLATVSDWGVIAVQKHSSDAKVYLLPFDGDRTEAVSFRDAVSRANAGQAA
jgi:hypothetical protein